VAVNGTQIGGPVQAGKNGKGLATKDDAGSPPAGKLGGYVTQTELFGALSTYYTSSCGACSGFTDPLIAKNDKDKWQCDPDAETGAEGCKGTPNESICVNLAKYCTLVLPILKPDVDSDKDGTKESISLGLRFSLESAVISGLTPDAVK
jgi:hypothetical protein